MTDRCTPKPILETRELVGAEQAGQLEELFKVLGNDTRIRLLHVLIREKEAPVNEIADQLGMSAQAVSSHLQKLALSGIVGSRRDGTFIYYRVLDPCVPILLDRGLCLLEERGSKASSK
jgi:ArsR family transcriptional regulator, lead/cadmium/zinc/bismuth-responsive transcriptional repressor